jgi:hypothetical protein
MHWDHIRLIGSETSDGGQSGKDQSWGQGLNVLGTIIYPNNLRLAEAKNPPFREKTNPWKIVTKSLH